MHYNLQEFCDGSYRQSQHRRYNIDMRIRILTIFPDQFESFLRHPLTARAIERGLLDLGIIDLKEYADGSFRHIDDSPYGGGAGMILRCEPVFRALDACRTPQSRVIAFTPTGSPYHQTDAHRLKEAGDLILICGHYEGMDERIMTAVDEEISVGDYILSGGELPAMTITDSLIRLLDGTIRADSTAEESFENGLLEYPQYTRPASFQGMDVPEVLRSGHAEKIRRWRLKESLRKTMTKRPDLLADRLLNEEEQQLLEEIRNEGLEGN
jgi:tRNA (guanine37-N1)-methyltransferase